jgi:hypothetical protein
MTYNTKPRYQAIFTQVRCFLVIISDEILKKSQLFGEVYLAVGAYTVGSTVDIFTVGQ